MWSHSRVRALCFFVVCATALPVRADDAFSSDRPGYSNSTSVAPVLRPITEIGGTVAWDPDDGTAGTFPDLRIRVGASRWLELRVDVPTILFDDPMGVGDLTLALKLGSPVAGTLAVALVPSVTIPVGTGDGPTTGRLELNWSASAGIVGFGGNFAASVVNDAMDQRHLRGEGSVALGVQLAGVLTLYAQAFMLWTEDEDPLPYAGIGAYLQAHPRVQTDLYVDVGLTDDTTRLVIGAGLTVLWGETPQPVAEDAMRPPMQRSRASARLQPAS